MFAAASAVLALALPVIASPTPTTPTAHTRFRRAGVTGCTCYGQTAPGSSDPLFYGSSVNGVGWCFEEGNLRPDWVAHINNALASGVADEWVNTPVALQQCATAGISDVSDCANYLIDNFVDAILSSSHQSTTYIAECNLENRMVEGSYEQTDCQCAWICINGYERCGDDGCMDPDLQQCTSGKIEDKVIITRKRAVQCPVNFQVCRARSSSATQWECIDTQTDIEACGGCPHTEGSVDCTGLPGIAAVSCRAGSCVVEGCTRGFRLVNGECVKSTSARK